ncbi:YHS domain-containing protein [Planctomycetota bacterium]
MNAKKKHLVILLLLIGVLLIGPNGCRKSEPQGHEGHEHEAAAQVESAAEALTETVKEVALAIEQKTCPVMGGPIDKAVFTEYKGKKVYFCCPGCDVKFKVDPEKYIVKLPQFKD